jgi:hypothetical protein
MTTEAQDAQVFVSKAQIGYQLHLTTDGIVGKHVLTIYQPGTILGTASMLKECEMEAIAIAAANALSQIRRG